MDHDTLFDTEENRSLIAICARRLIRNIGVGGIVWGAVNIAIGILTLSASSLNLFLVILGVIMLGAGAGALKRPTLGALLAETLVTGLLFLWNLAVAIFNTQAGAPFEVNGLIFPLAIAVGFVNSYRKLGHLRELIATVPEDQIAATKRLCKTIVKTPLKSSPFLVQTTNRRCRGQLIGDRAFFIQRDLLRAFLAPREAVRAALSKPESKTWTATFQHPLGQLTYRFDRKNTEKIRDWLAPAPASNPD